MGNAIVSAVAADALVHTLPALGVAWAVSRALPRDEAEIDDDLKDDVKDNVDELDTIRAQIAQLTNQVNQRNQPNQGQAPPANANANQNQVENEIENEIENKNESENEDENEEAPQAADPSQIQTLLTEIQQLKQGMERQKPFDDTVKVLSATLMKLVEQQVETLALTRRTLDSRISVLERTNEVQMRSMGSAQLQTRYDEMLTMYHQFVGVYQDRSRLATRLSTEYQDLLIRVRQESKKVKEFEKEREDEDMLRVVLFGPTGHGKSTLANRLFGDHSSTKGTEGPFTVGFGVCSETSGIQKEIIRKVYKKPLCLVDQPGVDDTEGRDREHANNLVEYLRGIGFIHAIVLVKLFNPRRFGKGYQSMLKALEEMLGKEMWKHVVLVVTDVRELQSKEWYMYSQALREEIVLKMELDSKEIELPIIGVDNCGGYTAFKRKLEHLIDKIVPTFGKFECKSLRSPLQALKAEMEVKKRGMDEAILNRNQSKKHLDKLAKQIRECEAHILAFNPNFKSRFRHELDKIPERKPGKPVLAEETKSMEVSSEKDEILEDILALSRFEYEVQQRQMKKEQESGGASDEDIVARVKRLSLQESPMETERGTETHMGPIPEENGSKPKWRCSLCQFDNHPDIAFCELCDTHKDGKYMSY